MTTLTNSISNHELWGFGSAFKSNLVASGNNHGPVMIKETHNGFDWYNGTGADQGNTDVNPLDDRYIYSNGYSNYRYFRTGPHTLINESNFLDLGGIYSYFNSIEFHPNNYYTIITHHAGQYPTGNTNLNLWKRSLIKTEDNGNSISIVKTFTNQVFREKISMKNPDHMYVIEGLTNNKLWYTDDAGATWTDVTPSSAESSGQTNISDVAVSDENSSEVWLTYSGVQSTCKILKSTNNGSSWTNLTQPILSDFPMTKIVFQRGSNGGVYVGNKSGIYYKNNSMSNWTALGMILGIVALFLTIFTTEKNKKKMDLNIKEITTINEMAITIGLIMLTIGNFLGGMWANESWGRYWGWDPKETWALVSIMVYAFVLHMRLIPGLRSRYTFNLWSILAYGAIMMTYFGVNFYLSGLHSYASGDQVITPNSVFYSVGFISILGISAWFKHRKFYKK